MAFTEYKAAVATNRLKLQPDSVSVGVNGKKNLNMQVVLGPAVMKKCGLLFGDKVKIYFGTEDDKGSMLLKKTDQGGVVVTKYSKSKPDSESAGSLIRKVDPIEPIKDFCNHTIPREFVKHEWNKDNGGLVVALPVTFFTEP